MKLDAELDLWRTQWQAISEAPVLSDLRKRVARQSRYMRWMLMGDVLVTVVIGGGAIFWAVADPRVETALLAAAVWGFIAAAWIFGLSNRKGAWSPAASTTSAFLDLSLRRCRGSLRAVKFGAVLYVSEVAFSLGWVFHDLSREKPMPLERFLTSLPVVIVWIATLLFTIFLVRYRAKKRAELHYLLNIQRELQQSDGASSAGSNLDLP